MTVDWMRPLRAVQRWRVAFQRPLLPRYSLVVSRKSITKFLLTELVVLAVVGPMGLAILGPFGVLLVLIFTAHQIRLWGLSSPTVQIGVRAIAISAVMIVLVGSLGYAGEGPFGPPSGWAPARQGIAGVFMLGLVPSVVATFLMMVAFALPYGLIDGQAFLDNVITRSRSRFAVVSWLRSSMPEFAAFVVVAWLAFGFTALPLPEAIAKGVAGAAGWLIGSVPGGLGGLLVGGYLGARLRPAVLVFPLLWPFFRVMLVPVAGFTLGYAIFVMIFAGYYAAAHHMDPAGAFRNVGSSASLGDFIFFSLMTVTTLGYSDLRPQSPLTQMLVALESIITTGWMVIVFAAVLAYLGPTFASLGRQGSKRSGKKTRHSNTGEDLRGTTMGDEQSPGS